MASGCHVVKLIIKRTLTLHRLSWGWLRLQVCPISWDMGPQVQLLCVSREFGCDCFTLMESGNSSMCGHLAHSRVGQAGGALRKWCHGSLLAWLATGGPPWPSEVVPWAVGCLDVSPGQKTWRLKDKPVLGGL